jgi:PAS domain S-box-containing protein
VAHHRTDEYEMLASLIRNVTGVVYRCSPDSDWAMEFISDGIGELSGYPASDFIASAVRTYASVIHPDDRELVEQGVSEAIGDRRSFYLEYRLTRSDGSIRWVGERGQGTFGDDGTVVHLEGAIFDITDRKVAERRLKKAEWQHRMLVEGLPLVTYIVGLDGVMTYIAPQVEAMLGYSAADIEEGSGSLLSENLHPDDRELVLAEAARCHASGGDLTMEYRLFSRDGDEVWVLDKAVDMLDADGRRLYRQGFLLDISDRKRVELERQSIEQELRLAHRMESVGQLAAGIAHEINTPIQFVGDSVRFISDGVSDLMVLVDGYRDSLHALAPDANGERRERLRSLEEQCDLAYLTERLPAAFTRTFDGVERVAVIVRSMKEFAHPSTQIMAAADLNAAIRSTLVVATHELKYHCDVVTDLADLPMVVCNIGDLNQVFLNLFVNAAHAIADVADQRGRGTLTVTTRRDGDHVVITVDDTGAGVPAEIQERVFTPFFTTKAVGRGTGQGLALARTIVVDRHAGEITLRSAEGAGASFVVRLRIAGPQLREAAA